MAIFTAGNISGGMIAGSAANLCKSLRDTLHELQNLYQYLSAQSSADLQSTGLSASDLQFIMTACADGNALALIYSTGLPPGTYPQPASAYTYASSQRQIIGP